VSGKKKYMIFSFQSFAAQSNCYIPEPRLTGVRPDETYFNFTISSTNHINFI